MPDWFEALGEPVPPRRQHKVASLLSEWNVESPESLAISLSRHVKHDRPKAFTDLARQRMDNDMSSVYRLMAVISVDNLPPEGTEWRSRVDAGKVIDFDSVYGGLGSGDTIEVAAKGFTGGPPGFGELDDERQKFEFVVTNHLRKTEGEAPGSEIAMKRPGSHGLQWRLSDLRMLTDMRGSNWFAEEVRLLGA